MVEKLVIPLITAVAGFLLGIFGDEIKDRLFPPETSATISNVQLERGVGLAQYLKSTGRPLDDFSTRQLRQIGVVVLAGISTTGYKGDDLLLDGRVIDAATGSALSRPLAIPDAFRPNANKASQSPNIWVSDPCMTGRYFVALVVTHWSRSSSDDRRAVTRKQGPTFKAATARCRGRLRP